MELTASDKLWLLETAKELGYETKTSQKARTAFEGSRISDEDSSSVDLEVGTLTQKIKDDGKVADVAKIGESVAVRLGMQYHF